MRKIILFFLLNIFLIGNSNALIEIDITRGNLDPLPIAVSPLHVDVKSQNYEGVKIKELGENISKIIEDNFKATGLFNPLKKEAFVQKPDIAFKAKIRRLEIDKSPSIGNWKTLNKDGKLKVEFRLWDLALQKK